MEMRQLQYFVSVAEEEHFTRAADRLLVAQPAISQQVRRLEAELGEALFDRDRRHVRLTAAGRAFLPHARATLAAAEQARAAVGSLKDLLTGKLTVGTFEGAPKRLLSRALGQFRRAHPAVDVRVREDYATKLLAAVRRGEIDAAITAQPDDRKVLLGVNTVEVGREQLVLVTSVDNRFANCSEISLVQLRDEPMVALISESTQRTHIEQACRKEGFEPRVIAECRHLGLLWDLVEEGIGVAIVPRTALRGDSHVAAIPIVLPSLSIRIMVASSQGVISPAGRVFLDTMEMMSLEAEVHPTE